jgi:small-conductance mechanosensitive channel
MTAAGWAQESDVDSLTEALSVDSGLSAWDWAEAGIILVSAVVISRLVRLLVRRAIGRRTDAAVVDLVGRLSGYVVIVVGLIYALDGIGVAVGPLLGALGIVGIALAFALRDILENFVAGVLLQFRRPFSYGDQIVSGEIEGTVAAIDARSVTVVTPGGETVYLPSSKVITEAIVNHTQHGARRSDVPIGIAYGSDLERARTVFLEAVRGVDGVLDDPAPDVLVTGFGDSSIDLVVWFWHAPTIADHWRAQSAVTLALDDACRRHGIEIPFPQRVLWSGIETRGEENRDDE